MKALGSRSRNGRQRTAYSFSQRPGRYIYHIEHFFSKGPLSTGQASRCFYLQEPVVEGEEEGREPQSKKQVREGKHQSATGDASRVPVRLVFTGTMPPRALCLERWALLVDVVIVLPEQPWITLLNLNGGTPPPRNSLCMCVGGWLSQRGAHGCSGWDSPHSAYLSVSAIPQSVPPSCYTNCGSSFYSPWLFHPEP